MRPRVSLGARLMWLVLAVTAGCGDDAVGTEPDAGRPPDAGAPDAGIGLAPPMPPSPIGPESCPGGWTRRELAPDVHRCEPFPEGIPDCPDGEFAPPSEGRCVLVGTPCPADGFPADLPADTPIAFVRAGAAPGGDGTRERPYASLGPALSRPSGTIVAVGRGEYEAMVSLDRDLTIWGACASETILRPVVTTPLLVGVVTARAGRSTLRNITVTGPQFGIDAQMSAELVLDRVIVRDVADIGVLARDNALIEGHSIDVRRVTPTGVSVGTSGLRSEDTARVSVERVSVTDITGRGIELAGPGSTLADALVHHLSGAGGGASLGLFVFADGVRVDRVVVRDIPTVAGVAVQRSADFHGTFLDVRDVNTASSSGDCVRVLECVSARIDDLTVDNCGQSGVLVNASTGVLRGFTVTRVGRDLAVQDRALVAEEAATTWEIRGAFATGIGYGLAATGGSTLTVSDLVIEDTIPSEGGRGGLALLAQDASRLRAERARLSRTRYFATGVISGAQLALTDVRIEDVAHLEDAIEFGPGRFGRAVGVQGGSAILTRVHIERARELAIAVMVAGTLEARDLRIADTQPRACADGPCAGNPGGVGLGVYHGSTATVTSFDIGHSALAAVQLVEGELDLADGFVHDNPIGINVQIADYDLDRLSSRVRFDGNGTNLDSQDLPVPDIGTE